MSRYDLLPPNATPLERDFSRATSFLERIGRTVPTIRTAKRLDIPDAVVPWLIYEYGLAEVLEYLPDARLTLADGIAWQRVRGTPQAILIGLSWLGISGTIDESEGGSYRWAEYQLGLPAPVQGLQNLTRIVGVTTISQPVRSRLQRIFSVYDHRRFILDDSLLSEGSPLSDHTGTRPLGDDGPQISFGDYRRTLIDATGTVAPGITTAHAALVPYIDTFLLDHSFIDEEWHLLNDPISRVDVISGSVSRTVEVRWGETPWSTQRWDGSADAAGGKITTIT
jgi:P2-related tail formation protein